MLLRSVMLLRSALLLLSPALAAATPGAAVQMSAGSQPTSTVQSPAPPPFVDPATLRPTPRAADVASVDAIVAAVYDGISGPAGPRDWDRFKSLLLPECRLTPAGHRPDGQDVYRVMDADGYIERAGPTFLKEGFFEAGVAHTVEQFGNIAHVFSTYESRHDKGAAPFARGINSMQLVKLGTRWWIASIMWEAERSGVTSPISIFRGSSRITDPHLHRRRAVRSRRAVMPDTSDRRQFLKTTLGAGLGAAVAAGAHAAESSQGAAARAAGPKLLAVPPIDRVRVGIIGLGHQGSSHLSNFLKVPGAEVRALCDLVPAKLDKALAACAKAGAPKPVTYTGGPEEWKRLCDSDLDLVFIVTPWELHAPMCIEAMGKGKHAATEVPMAPTIDECWQLVDTSEKTGRHCVMMENCCYDREEMMILNMVRQGVFGELLHAECGYLHDLRELKLSRTYYEGRWRMAHSIRRNGDLYPTHGLGPVCQWMDVNRGNRLESLVSVSTKSRGLNLWAEKTFGPDSQEAKQKYALGDVVNTLIRTTRGETILVTHDTNTPRPYSRKIQLQGTKGIVQKYPTPPRVYIEGTSPNDKWDTLQAYADTYEHPIWRSLGEQSKEAGHGGMDYIEDFRLVQCLRAGTPTDMDVYDGAAWSSISELTEKSIAGRGQSVDCPDFTRGAWQARPPLGIVTG